MSGASRRRTPARMADRTLVSRTARAPARAVAPDWRKWSAAARRAANSSAVGAWKMPSSPEGMRNRTVGGSAISSIWGKASRTASRMRSTVRRETCRAAAISSRVRPSADAASRRASSRSRAAFSCRMQTLRENENRPETYVRFWRSASAFSIRTPARPHGKVPQMQNVQSIRPARSDLAFRFGDRRPLRPAP